MIDHPRSRSVVLRLILLTCVSQPESHQTPLAFRDFPSHSIVGRARRQVGQRRAVETLAIDTRRHQIGIRCFPIRPSGPRTRPTGSLKAGSSPSNLVGPVKSIHAGASTLLRSRTGTRGPPKLQPGLSVNATCMSRRLASTIACLTSPSHCGEDNRHYPPGTSPRET